MFRVWPIRLRVPPIKSGSTVLTKVCKTTQVVLCLSISCFNDQHCLTFVKLQPPISASVRLRRSGAGFRRNSPYPTLFQVQMLRFRNDLPISERFVDQRSTIQASNHQAWFLLDLVALRPPLRLFSRICDPSKIHDSNL